MKERERFFKLVRICERAEMEAPIIINMFGSRIDRLMDLKSADKIFNLRLDDLLNADDENFYHDLIGIWRESDRSTYPCTFGMFVPRFAGKGEKS